MALIDNNNPPVLDDEDYVDKIKSSLDAIDGHDHSTGKGAPITAAGLADNSVTTTKIADNNVTMAKLEALTASRALQTGAGGKPEVSAVTATELGHVAGLTSAAVGTSDTQSLSNKTFSDSVYIGAGSIHASAILQADSTTQGALAPRMTTAQRDAIATPATGLMIYNTDTVELNQYNGVSWTGVGSGGGEAGINYVTNPNAEVDASGWNVYSDAASATPTDGI